MERTSSQIDILAAHERTSGQFVQMSVAEMVERFGVSERTARRHRARGTVPADARLSTYRAGKPISMPAKSPLFLNSTFAWKQLVVARNAIRNVRRSRRLEERDLRLAIEMYDDMAMLTTEMAATLAAQRAA